MPDFTIQSPDPDRRVPLFKNKFALTVKGPPEQVHRLHSVLKDPDGKVIAGDYPVRDDGKNTARLWTTILDLGCHSVNSDWFYTLEISRQTGGSRPEPIHFGTTIRFQFGPLLPAKDKVKKERKRVEIIYPGPGSYHSRYGFTPYGIVDDPGEYVTSGLGKVSDIMNMTDDYADAGDTDIDGFWWLTFDEVATVTQNLNVESNLASLDTVLNLTFS